jgi:N-acylneuraminate cytidylyltransferase
MKSKKNCIAIIPARSGSKRIKNKNIKIIKNLPVIAHTIIAAKKSKVFDYIMVSTDCKKIAKIAKLYGANIDFIRPRNLSNDTTKTIDVIKHAIKFYKNKFKYSCCLYPASPFIKYQNIKYAYRILKKKKHDMVLTLQEFPSLIQRALKVKNSKVQWHNSYYKDKNSNSLKKYYYDGGQFYFGESEKFLKKKNIIDKKTFPIILKKFENIDINDYDDWNFAKKLLERFK